MLLYMQKETQYKTEPLPYRKQGVVGRVSYAYDGRYFIEGNFGYTGSEAFAKNHRFGFFPAVGVAYYLSNEPFYPKAIKKIANKIKIRASVGKPVMILPINVLFIELLIIWQPVHGHKV